MCVQTDIRQQSTVAVELGYVHLLVNSQFIPFKHFAAPYGERGARTDNVGLQGQIKIPSGVHGQSTEPLITVVS